MLGRISQKRRAGWMMLADDSSSMVAIMLANFRILQLAGRMRVTRLG
jgi:hypothetical protein